MLSGAGALIAPSARTLVKKLRLRFYSKAALPDGSESADYIFYRTGVMKIFVHFAQRWYILDRLLVFQSVWPSATRNDQTSVSRKAQRKLLLRRLSRQHDNADRSRYKLPKLYGTGVS